MILKVRLGIINKYKQTKFKNAKNISNRFNLSKKYLEFLGNRTKKKTFIERNKMIFK